MTSQEGLNAMLDLNGGATSALTLNALVLWGWMHFDLPLPGTLPQALIPLAVTSLPTLVLFLTSRWLPSCSEHPHFTRWGLFFGQVIWTYCLLCYLISPNFFHTLLW